MAHLAAAAQSARAGCLGGLLGCELHLCSIDEGVAPLQLGPSGLLWGWHDGPLTLLQLPSMFHLHCWWLECEAVVGLLGCLQGRLGSVPVCCVHPMVGCLHGRLHPMPFLAPCCGAIVLWRAVHSAVGRAGLGLVRLGYSAVQVCLCWCGAGHIFGVSERDTLHAMLIVPYNFL